MKKFMNEPVEWNVTDNDIVKEFRIVGDVKKVAKIYGLEVKEVRDILSKTEIH